MKTLVKTNLAVGKEKNYYYDEYGHSIRMYDNQPFEKTYNNMQEFLKDFNPTKPSDTLISRIEEEFNKNDGTITFKPIGYKANQRFLFKKI